MYLINTLLTVNWLLLTDDAPPDLADLDIRIIDPDGVSTYTANAIDGVGTYTPSSAGVKGAVSYPFTPDAVGLWTVGLSNGTSGSNLDYYTHDIMVSTNDILTKKFVKGSLL